MKTAALFQLLPIEPGEHRTRRGLRAFVVGVDLYAYGFVEVTRKGRVVPVKEDVGHGDGSRDV